MNVRRNIVLIGMKSSGKTTVGRILAHTLDLRFTDADAELERLHAERTGEHAAFREIFQRHGNAYFRELEIATLQSLAAAPEAKPMVLATGGGLPLAEANQPLLRRMGTIVFLDVAEEVLLARIVPRGIPAFFPYPEDPARSLAELLAARRPVYRALAHLTVSCRAEPPETVAAMILEALQNLSHED